MPAEGIREDGRSGVELAVDARELRREVATATTANICRRLVDGAQERIGCAVEAVVLVDFVRLRTAEPDGVVILRVARLEVAVDTVVLLRAVTGGAARKIGLALDYWAEGVAIEAIVLRWREIGFPTGVSLG